MAHRGSLCVNFHRSFFFCGSVEKSPFMNLEKIPFSHHYQITVLHIIIMLHNRPPFIGCNLGLSKYIW
jgi:hypothetical protein